MNDDARASDAPVLPRSLRKGPPEGVRVVAFAHTQNEQARAACLLVRAARAWARCGHRVVAADLNLDAPTLHEEVGVENLEGVTDIFLYGASVARSARPVPDGGFYLISAGTYSSDPRSVLDPDRWRKLAGGFREASALLVLLVPESLAAEGPTTDWVDGWVLVGDVAKPADGRILTRCEASRAEPPEVARQVPAPAVAAPESPPQTPDRDEPAGETAPAREDSIRTVADDAETLPGSTPPPEGSPESGPAAGGAVGETARRRRRSRGRGGRLFVWLLLAVLFLVVGTVVLWLLRPDILSPFDLGVLPAGGVAAAAAPSHQVPEGVEPESAALPYSIEVRNYASSRAAREHLEADRARFAEVTFFISPTLDRGVLYHRLMAGPAADTAEAAELRGVLEERGIVSNGGAARADRIEPTPLAFDLGVRATESAARELEDSLATRGIPGYVVPVAFTDGRERWRVYGGAFPDSLRADPMRRMIEEMGMAAELVERVGRTSVPRR